MTESEYKKWVEESTAILSKAVEDAYNKIFKATRITDDERVILKNIDQTNFNRIGRQNETLYLKATEPYGFGQERDNDTFWYCYHELFQWIKERRGIHNRRINKGVITNDNLRNKARFTRKS